MKALKSFGYRDVIARTKFHKIHKANIIRNWVFSVSIAAVIDFLKSL